MLSSAPDSPANVYTLTQAAKSQATSYIITAHLDKSKPYCRVLHPKSSAAFVSKKGKSGIRSANHAIVCTTMSKAKFEKAVAIVQSLPKDGPIQPSNDDRLYFYKYYKQATIGDNNTARPGIFDFMGKAKWDAWESAKGTSEAEAYKKYVEKLEELLRNAKDTERLAEIESVS